MPVTARPSPPRRTAPARRGGRFARAWAAGVLAWSTGAGAAALADAAPEPQTARTPKSPVIARAHMAVTAHPLASQAADGVLARGGSAVDAAIAAQMVLTLVEPQSSGLGGGAFLLHYAATDGRVSVIDGRETAPAAASAGRFAGAGAPSRFIDAVDSGAAVGTPGLLRALERAHQRFGRLPWADLFQPAIALASGGFPISPRLAALIDGNDRLAAQPAARAYFFHPDGRPRQAGETLRNPALARTLRVIAHGGADAFYRGPLAHAIVDAVARHPRPGDLTLDDLARYRAVERAPVCGRYRRVEVCGMPPPSAGGVALLQMLAILQPTPIRLLGPPRQGGLPQPLAVHYIADAGRLAYADRDHYIADPGFIDVPTAALLDPGYLGRRAALVSATRTLGRAAPGEPLPGARQALGPDRTQAQASTSHLSIVDRDGNAVAMTSSIEQAFGSKIWVDGFLLNNQLTDFSLAPQDAAGRPAANRVEAGKRPRSAMAPTIVLDPTSTPPRLRLVAGAPGGSAIINYVATTLVAHLDWGLDIQAAIDLPHFGSRNRETELEAGQGLEALAPALEALGHPLRFVPLPSGLHAIERLPDGRLRGGADPRREGLALGR